MEGDREIVIPAADVKKGALVRVHPGETVPVDGVVLKGETSVDESVLTGEPMPVDKTAGDRVMSGSINRFGVFDLRAESVGEGSTIARMAKLVESADAGRAKIVRLADKWATWIVVAALSTAVLTWLITGEEIRAVTILVVFCPCALVLATPTAVMAAIGCAAKRGVLIREGDALERLAQVDRTAFDKTGTLTTGEPVVTAVMATDAAFTSDEVFQLAAIAEKNSEHPLGAAVVKGWSAKHDAQVSTPVRFAMESGSGVSAEVESGIDVMVGRAKWLLNKSVDGIEAAEDAAQPFREEGATAVFVAVNGRTAGFVVLEDKMRPGIRGAVAAVKRLGVAPMLMTGDHRASALHVAM